MEQVGESVARELDRFGPASGMAPLVEAWPTAVGAEIARNAWPARLARDGTLHVHTRDSVWAFELSARVQEVRERLGAAAPERIVFTPGPLPSVDADAPRAARKTGLKPTGEHLEKAASLTRAIRDEELRKVVAKTVAASLAANGTDRPFC